MRPIMVQLILELCPMSPASNESIQSILTVPGSRVAVFRNAELPLEVEIRKSPSLPSIWPPKLQCLVSSQTDDYWLPHGRRWRQRTFCLTSRIQAWNNWAFKSSSVSTISTKPHKLTRFKSPDITCLSQTITKMSSSGQFRLTGDN